ncbi:MAG TPA: type II toxin-antitoxin system PemK/MazF family toxin [Pyrinomonadaceae bacterium]|nr:type II toxin-antitoxin system PemK/MazF family toxin [Pyrinomonadaceae bacterium]
MVNRFDVFLVNLDHAPSDDAKNTRPGVVISPDEANPHLDHVIVAPLASTNAKYPTRVSVEFLNSERFVILDQMRAVDKTRLVKKIGNIAEASQEAILDRLSEFFAK